MAESLNISLRWKFLKNLAILLFSYLTAKLFISFYVFPFSYIALFFLLSPFFLVGFFLYFTLFYLVSGNVYKTTTTSIIMMMTTTILAMMMLMITMTPHWNCILWMLLFGPFFTSSLYVGWCWFAVFKISGLVLISFILLLFYQHYYNFAHTYTHICNIHAYIFLF